MNVNSKVNVEIFIKTFSPCEMPLGNDTFLYKLFCTFVTVNKGTSTLDLLRRVYLEEDFEVVEQSIILSCSAKNIRNKVS